MYQSLRKTEKWKGHGERNEFRLFETTDSGYQYEF